jgi:hypothetical protein
MKKILLYSTALLSILLSGCSNDGTEQINQGSVATTLNASIPTSATRVTLAEDGATTLKTTWDNSDAIKVANATQSNANDFTAASNAGGLQSTSFSANLTTPLADNDQLYAFYPNSLTVNSNVATVDYSAQSYSTQAAQLSEMAKKAAMYAAAKYATAGTTLAFKNATTILRLKLTFPADLNIKNITLSATGLANKGDITVAAANTSSVSNTTAGDIVASFTTPFAVTAGAAATTYLLAVPQTGLSNVTIIATTDKGLTYKHTLAATSVNFVAGKMQTLTATMTQALLVGDVIYSDGGNSTAANYDTYMEAHSGVTPVGICFYVGSQLYDGENTKNGTWGSYVDPDKDQNNIRGYSKKTFTVPSAFHGYMFALNYLNNNAVCTYTDALTKLTAYNTSNSISSISSCGWFLPSVPVLLMGGYGDKTNTAIMDKVNDTFHYLAAKKISDYDIKTWGLWTSSKYSDDGSLMTSWANYDFNHSEAATVSLYARAIAII